MARIQINVGFTPNDNTGDTIRDAFIKVNSNFAEQYSSWMSSTSYAVGNSSVNTSITPTSISVRNIIANTSPGTNGQFLTSNGSGIYWSQPVPSVNTASQYNWTNTQTFSSSIVISNTFIANGSPGAQGQYLASSNTGVYWKTITTPPPTSQSFIANGSTTSFLIAAPIIDINSSIVTVDGLVQVPTVQYTITGTTITFVTVPVAGSVIEIRNFEFLGRTSTSQTFTSTGSSSLVLMTAPVDASSIIVTVDGLIQIPNLDYTVSGTTLTFISVPSTGSVIEVRTLARL